MSSYSQQDILQTIPKHLRQFVIDQNYTQYTAENHAVWRFIMKQQKQHLSRHAHEVYLEGLDKTGISIDHIPSIEEMNACLHKLGWRAVIIDGYIPTAAFMEFHSHKIMPIALDMRAIEHILYTPTPDIVHEAGGHASFLVDVDYSEYLQKFGEYGAKAIPNRHDYDIYEAIRDVSILKEDPRSTTEAIFKSEQHLAKLSAATSAPSESALLGRLYWWTVEYGLVGTIENYKIFGAGLLSSLGEARSCLDDKTVKKIPYAVDATRVPFDITRVQPQLFVTKGCQHMMQVLEEFADNMCFRVGGASSLRKAIASQTVCTAEYCSGLQVSGLFSNALTNSVDREIYIQTTGATQLSYQNKQIEGHGIDHHTPGFGAPVGGLQGIEQPLEILSVDELKRHNIVKDKSVKLEFLSGITVAGILRNITRRDGKNLIFSFENCTVTTWDGEMLFKPEWGVYDMAVGRRIVSVYAGAADRELYDTYPKVSDRHPDPRQYTSNEIALFNLYQSIRNLREQGKFTAADLEQLYQSTKGFADNWLLRYELLELANTIKTQKLSQNLTQELKALKSKSTDLAQLISHALESITS